jgi:nucleotide-binding universal stress UspA family protein
LIHNDFIILIKNDHSFPYLVLYNWIKGEMTMGFEYNNILVAIDGSKEAECAFKKAVEIAKRNNANLLLAHVVDQRTYAYAGVEVDPFERNIAERGEQIASKMLENYKEKAINAGLTKIDCIIEFGSPKVKIPKDIARAKNCDLIICGATGLNAVERLLMGSVSEHITRFASCDVLIVREEAED